MHGDGRYGKRRYSGTEERVMARKRGIGAALGLDSGKVTRIANKSNAMGVLKVILFMSCLTIVIAAFAFLDGYVKKQSGPEIKSKTIEIACWTPEWVSDEIKNRVIAASTADTNNPGLEDNSAAGIQKNIERLVPWLADVRVQNTYNSTRITGRWRKPIALVTTDKNQKFFLDTDLVVLDYIPINGLTVVTVTGLQFDKNPPVAGKAWQGNDLSAGLAVLERLERMDANLCPTKPLMRLIDKIDVSNYDGRKSKHDPHITLSTKDGTQIIWGAEIGTWQRHLESTDEDKLAKLYTFYQQNQALSGVKYINLRDPQQRILLPVDKY